MAIGTATAILGGLGAAVGAIAGASDKTSNTTSRLGLMMPKLLSRALEPTSRIYFLNYRVCHKQVQASLM